MTDKKERDQVWQQVISSERAHEILEHQIKESNELISKTIAEMQESLERLKQAQASAEELARTRKNLADILQKAHRRLVAGLVLQAAGLLPPAEAQKFSAERLLPAELPEGV